MKAPVTGISFSMSQQTVIIFMAPFASVRLEVTISMIISIFSLSKFAFVLLFLAGPVWKKKWIKNVVEYLSDVNETFEAFGWPTNRNVQRSRYKV